MDALSRIEESPLVKVLPIREQELDVSKLLVTTLALSGPEGVPGCVGELRGAIGHLLAEGLPGDPERLARANNVILTLREVLQHEEHDIFVTYMRGVLEGKRIVQSYRQMAEAFPPGSVTLAEAVNLLCRLASHISLEVERFAAARTALKALTEKINSILEGDGDLNVMDVLESARPFMEG
jgi:hypothetical protein